MRNKLYRFNRWLDNNEIIKFFLLLFSVALFTIPLQFGNFIGLIISLSTILIVCLFTILRMKIMEDVVQFDRSKYDVPEVGEIVVVKKEFFFYDGYFRKWRKVKKGTQLVILDVEESNGDWKIRFLDPKIGLTRGNIDLYYLDTKDYWETKSNIRNKILSKIGI